MFVEKRFAENLKAYRKAEKLSQGALARLLNLSPQSISKWERGESYPDIEKLVALSDIFNVAVDTLIGHSNEQKKIMIAIDGGGTKTEFIMFSEDGIILEHLTLGGCNPNSVGIEKSVEVLCRGIDTFLNICPSVCGVYVGAAGVLLGNKSSQITNSLKKKYPHIRIRCATDILNVIASADIDEDCIAVICGTGSSILVKNGDELHVVAGWGYLVGKWGSGFDIARDGLHSALAHTEKIGRPTVITKLLQAKSEKTVYELLDEVYKHDPSYMASFAPIVLEAYAMGDEVAKEILNENAQRLAQTINCAHRVYSSGKKVVISGGLCLKNDVFQALLRSYLDTELDLLQPIYPQVYGACVLCARACGVDTELIKENFMTQYKRRIR